MGRKQVAILCASCDSQLRADSPFCPNCGRPTGWASHDERVAWEVRQWRASRAGQEGSGTTMMLVRTEAGYEPTPMRQGDQYVWDQPLHPEQEQRDAAARAEPAAPPPQTHNGNSNGHAEVEILPPPEPEVEAAAIGSDAVTVSASRVHPLADVPPGDEEVRVSKKAVAVGIVLALGLPLSGHVLNLARGKPEAARGPVAAPAHAAAGRIRPVALSATRSGFTQVSQDAARYAVVIQNPNRSLAARDIAVSISIHDRAGRLIGEALERVPAIAPGGRIAVAGQTAVAGRAARLRVGVSVSVFDPGGAVRSFIVRSAQMTRRGDTVVVRAAIAGTSPVRNARVVVVYLDRSGRILGGDFTFVDIPSRPRTASAVISTAGGTAALHRIEIYVVSPL